ncbi:hypothetical protein PN477_10705 [Spirulina subsalsa CS-330]|uniref:hypothetical protein n=1 Tax=Spirulina TaxID=1154 RepID=UPI00232BE348|nr:hypothetical protein [Spirulina subsalsa]MDB9495089.1 hypothetical protein [Spirulina subsalsa CS-330]
MIKTVNRRFSRPEQARIDELRGKNERGELTEIEHQELLVYVERAEEMDVIRLEAMMKLAELRAVTLENIMVEFPANLDQNNDAA